MKKKIYISLLIILGFLTLSYIDKPRIFGYTILQGNLFNFSQIDKINLGMNKKQVLFILGTPIINNSFNPNTLYYIYNEHTCNNKSNIVKIMKLTFNNKENLISININVFYKKI